MDQMHTFIGGQPYGLRKLEKTLKIYESEFEIYVFKIEKKIILFNLIIDNIYHYHKHQMPLYYKNNIKITIIISIII